MTPLVSRNPPIDGVADFVPVTLLASISQRLGGRPELPGQFAEGSGCCRQSQSRQDRLRLIGFGSMQHLAGAMLTAQAGLELTPFRTRADRRPSPMSSAAACRPWSSGFQGALPQIKEGKVRGLAVTGKQRSPAPDADRIRSAGPSRYEARTGKACSCRPAHPSRSWTHRQRGEGDPRRSPRRATGSQAGLRAGRQHPAEFAAIIADRSQAVGARSSRPPTSLRRRSAREPFAAITCRQTTKPPHPTGAGRTPNNIPSTRQSARHEERRASVYNHFVRVDAPSRGLLSGQVSRDDDGQQVGTGSMLEQTRQCIRNIEKSLTAAGPALSDIVWTTVYTTDMREFRQIVAAREEFFKDHLRPADGKSHPADPGLMVEIQVIPRSNRTLLPLSNPMPPRLTGRKGRLGARALIAAHHWPDVVTV